MTGCSVAESRLNAETWLDDRLESCKHISLLSQSPIFIYGISTRVGKQAVPTVLAWVVGFQCVSMPNFLLVCCTKLAGMMLSCSVLVRTDDQSHQMRPIELNPHGFDLSWIFTIKNCQDSAAQFRGHFSRRRSEGLVDPRWRRAPPEILTGLCTMMIRCPLSRFEIQLLNLVLPCPDAVHLLYC